MAGRLLIHRARCTRTAASSRRRPSDASPRASRPCCSTRTSSTATWSPRRKLWGGAATRYSWPFPPSEPGAAGIFCLRRSSSNPQGLLARCFVGFHEPEKWPDFFPTVRALRGPSHGLGVSHSKSVLGAFFYAHGGRLTPASGGFGPGSTRSSRTGRCRTTATGPGCGGSTASTIRSIGTRVAAPSYACQAGPLPGHFISRTYKRLATSI
jgi:hypothetical protein